MPGTPDAVAAGALVRIVAFGWTPRQHATDQPRHVLHHPDQFASDDANVLISEHLDGAVRQLEDGIESQLFVEETDLVDKLRSGELTAGDVLARYCSVLYRRLGTYAAVAQRTGLDPRTARKYVESTRSG